MVHCSMNKANSLQDDLLSDKLEKTFTFLSHSVLQSVRVSLALFLAGTSLPIGFIATPFISCPQLVPGDIVCAPFDLFFVQCTLHPALTPHILSSFPQTNYLWPLK